MGLALGLCIGGYARADVDEGVTPSIVNRQRQQLQPNGQLRSPRAAVVAKRMQLDPLSDGKGKTNAVSGGTEAENSTRAVSSTSPLVRSYPVPALVVNTLCRNPPLDPPAREPNQTAWLVAIRGERYSGTSWARQLVTLNVRDAEYITALYGHKHGDFTPEHAARLKSYPRHIMMFLWRNAFVWLLKMYQDPYCDVFTGHGAEHHWMRTDANGTLFEKARGPETLVSAAMLTMETNYSYFLRQKHKMPDEFGKQSCTFGESPSFMHVRNLRYRNWLAQMSIVGGQQTAGIQYEQLAADEGKRFLQMLDDRGVPHGSSFVNAGTRVKYGKLVPAAGSAALSFAKPVDEYMSKYTLDDIEYVLARLDPAVEHFAGYGHYEAERHWAVNTFGAEAANKAWGAFGKNQYIPKKQRQQ